MSSEKQNKMPAWKEGFLQWERSGGSAEPGENRLWEKLQGRLQPAHTKKRAFFFRAAAIVLFLLAIGFLLLQKSGAPADPVIVAKPADPVHQSPELKKIVPASAPVQPDLSQDKIKHPVKTAPITAPENIIAQPEEEKLAMTEPPETIQQQELAPIPLAIAAPQKKKLKVVHLNELNNPPPPTFASVKDEWSSQPSMEEITATVPSIWPGKNKPKPPVLLGN